MEKITRKEAHDIYGWLNEKNIVKFDKDTRKAIIGICRTLGLTLNDLFWEETTDTK